MISRIDNRWGQCQRWKRSNKESLIVGHYEREGEIKIGDTTLGSPSEREIARQERMKREG